MSVRRRASAPARRVAAHPNSDRSTALEKASKLLIPSHNPTGSSYTNGIPGAYSYHAVSIRRAVLSAPKQQYTYSNQCRGKPKAFRTMPPDPGDCPSWNRVHVWLLGSLAFERLSQGPVRLWGGLRSFCQFFQILLFLSFPISRLSGDWLHETPALGALQ